MPHSDSLTAAFDRVYAAFAAVPRPVAIDACSHCFDERETAELLREVPLRDLDKRVLRTYFGSLFSTVGDEADFRYFLPRLLEIAVENTFPDLGYFCSCLFRAAWADWAAEERAAVEEVMHVLWRESLRPDSGSEPAYRLLSNFQDGHFALSPYLDEWTVALRHEPFAAAALNETVCWSHLPVEPDYDPAGDVFGEQRREFATWLHGPEVRRALSESVARFGTPEAQEVLDLIAAITSDLAARASDPETDL